MLLLGSVPDFPLKVLKRFESSGSTINFRSLAGTKIIDELFRLLVYNYFMQKKLLIETNPYLKTPEKYWRSLVTNVASSTAIETGKNTKSIVKTLIESKTHRELVKSKAQK